MNASSGHIPGPNTTRARRRLRALVVAFGVVAAGSTTATADAATSSLPVSCPSPACVLVGHSVDPSAFLTADGHGSFYATSQNGVLSRIDIATGTTTTVATGLGNLRGIALDGAGDADIADFDGRVHQVNLTTGADEIIAVLPQAAQGIASNAGRVVVSTGGGELWQIASGAAPRLVASGLGTSLAVTLDGRGHAFTPDADLGQINEIDLTTGTVIPISSAFGIPTGVAYSASNNSLYVVDTDVLRLNLSTGQVTAVAQTPPAAFSIALDSNGNGLINSGTGDGVWDIKGLAALS